MADEKNYEKLKSDYEAVLKTFEEHDTAAKTAEAATKTAVDGAKRRRLMPLTRPRKPQPNGRLRIMRKRH